MQFFASLAALAATAATLVSANSVTFVNQDETVRRIIFTPNDGFASMDTIEVEASGTSKVEFSQGWIGNWYAVSEGYEDVPGMLGEVAFNGWNDLTYYDVSAIVNATDTNGVKEMFPLSQMNLTTKTSFSGCKTFPCNTVYIQWDDVQTVTTSETDLVCTLGTSPETVEKRAEHNLVARHYVLGKLS
ncbi:uncharacterized protein BCR38DRAFT_15279 [Pseudomassariella vexata]|uniref:DNase1 protein n=1 Tax=Pseudomassariella vexata TaxID=1141098 RepID=A0A1Y2EJA2_9PEZI|nr:uncharacterized protein BCR38DRAFT_15279 [Pseudomassariella vexata]ORY71639.1 hypothetical protein BCR38DRAFT_15279 [Pseudomassariella vexata]